jgi:hypothetical protein
MISLYVNAPLCTLQHPEFTPRSCIACMTICCSVHKNALTYKQIIFSTFSNHLHLFNFLCRVRDLRPRWSTRRRAGFSCATLYVRHRFRIYVQSRTQRLVHCNFIRCALVLRFGLQWVFTPSSVTGFHWRDLTWCCFSFLIIQFRAVGQVA